MPSLAKLIELTAEERQRRGLEFTPQEIAQQPETWEGTLAIFARERDRVAAFLERAGVRGPKERRPLVLLVGAGTSDYIGQALVLLLRQAWGCEVMAVASTDLLLGMEDWLQDGRPTMCVSFSRSGNSPEGVAVLERAIREHAEVAHLVVTCNASARMIDVIAGARAGCAVVLDDAVNDRSLAMTSSFTNMVIFGQCLAHTWSLEEYRPIHRDLVEAGRKMLGEAADAAEAVAATGVERACFVGSGALTGVARECALKLLELTAGQVLTMSETVLGLRHGPMAALNGRTLFVCFAPSDARRAMYARDLLDEIGAKGIASERVVVAPAELRAEFAGSAERFLAVEPAVPEVYRPVVDVMFGQMLGLLCSVGRGLRPDAPSPGGVITRVVQPFQIH